MPFSSVLSSLLKQNITTPLTPWSITTATIPVSVGIQRAVDIRFNIAGDYAYVLTFDSGTLKNERITLYSTSPFDITSITTLGTSGTTGAGRPFAMCGVLHDTLHANYGKLMYSTNLDGEIIEYTSATAFTSLTNNGQVASFTTYTGVIYFCDFYDNGNKLVIVGDFGMYVFSVSNYVLSGTYDTSTAIHTDLNYETTLGHAVGDFIVHMTWVGNGNYCYTFDKEGNIRVFDTSSAPYDYTAVSNTNFIETKTFGLSGSEYSLEFNRTAIPVLNDIGLFTYRKYTIQIYF
jgi:hypothetical protein